MIDSRFAYEYIYEQILKGIENGELKENGYLLSEKEYCKKFDVSLTTVRRALERLREEGIVEKIKGKGTLISSKVRKIHNTQNRYVGMLMLSFKEQDVVECSHSAYSYVNMYIHDIYDSIFSELKGEYNILIDTIAENEVEQRFPSSILTQVDNIFLIGSIRKHVIDYLHGLGKCLITYNYFEQDVMVCRVNSDERISARKLVHYFLEQGHTRIASINGIKNLSESLERYMGYQDAIMMSGLYIDSRYIKWGNMTPESGYNLTKELVEISPRPTCIICVNDGVAMGAYDAIEECGLRPGKDIVLAGHDNSVFKETKYRFTTIDPQYEQVGKVVASKLRRTTWIDDETIQPCNLIVRV